MTPDALQGQLFARALHRHLGELLAAREQHTRALAGRPHALPATLVASHLRQQHELDAQIHETARMLRRLHTRFPHTLHSSPLAG